MSRDGSRAASAGAVGMIERTGIGLARAIRPLSASSHRKAPPDHIKNSLSRRIRLLLCPVIAIRVP
jgi:hypothetical protein